MKEEISQLVQLIKEHKTVGDICQITGLSNKQLFLKLSMLKQVGYSIGQKYHYNGKIEYFINNSYENAYINANSNEINIQLPSNQNIIKFIVTSDNHIGSIKESIEAHDKMMDFCIKQNIHIILNCGDFFHGIYPSDERQNLLARYKTALSQISYGLKMYPTDPNIFTVIIMGNHDATFLIEEGIDINALIHERRQDIISLGYGSGVIKLRGAEIYLQHPIARWNIETSFPPNHLTFVGHSHKFRISSAGSGLKVQVGTMSYVPTFSNQNPIPSMIVANLTIDNLGIITQESFEYFMFLDGDFRRVTEVCYDAITPVSKRQQTVVKKLTP